MFTKRGLGLTLGRLVFNLRCISRSSFDLLAAAKVDSQD